MRFYSLVWLILSSVALATGGEHGTQQHPRERAPASQASSEIEALLTRLTDPSASGQERWDACRDLFAPQAGLLNNLEGWIGLCDPRGTNQECLDIVRKKADRRLSDLGRTQGFQKEQTELIRRYLAVDLSDRERARIREEFGAIFERGWERGYLATHLHPAVIERLFKTLENDSNPISDCVSSLILSQPDASARSRARALEFLRKSANRDDFSDETRRALFQWGTGSSARELAVDESGKKAIFGMAMSGHPAAYLAASWLLNHFSSLTPKEKSEATDQALALLKAPAAPPMIALREGDPRDASRRDLAQKLGRVNPEPRVVSYLLETLDKGDAWAGRGAARVVANLPIPKARAESALVAYEKKRHAKGDSTEGILGALEAIHPGSPESVSLLLERTRARPYSSPERNAAILALETVALEHSKPVEMGLKAVLTENIDDKSRRLAKLALSNIEERRWLHEDISALNRGYYRPPAAKRDPALLAQIVELTARLRKLKGE